MKLHAILQDEYKFFRGTADLFYDWCRQNTSDWPQLRDVRVRLHGDAHIGNLGTYQGRGPLGQDIRFGLVDLDESFDGPFQLDLLRAAASVRFLAASNGVTLTPGEWQNAIAGLCAAYRRGLEGGMAAAEESMRHPITGGLFKDVRGREGRAFVKRYSHLGDSPRFRRVRKKNGKVSDIMEPVSADERRAITLALWGCMESGLSAEDRGHIRFSDEKSFRLAVLDVARWTRIDSGGSQGVYKYLLLIDRPFDDADGPMILQFKQQPLPAAARAGLISESTPRERALDVARSFCRLLPWPKRMVGAAEFEGRGYLMMLKDPWGVEPSPKEFASVAKIGESLTLMGAVLGSAHRKSFESTPDEQVRVKSILAALNGLEAQIEKRSDAVVKHLRQQFQTLRNDPFAIAAVRTADEFIQMHRAKNP